MQFKARIKDQGWLMVLAIRLVDDHIVYMCCQRLGDFMMHVTTFKLCEKKKTFIPYYDI